MVNEEVREFIDKWYKENKHPALYAIRKNTGWSEEQVIEIIQAIISHINNKH